MLEKSNATAPAIPFRLLHIRLRGLLIAGFISYLITINQPIALYLGNPADVLFPFGDLLPVFWRAFCILFVLLLLPFALPSQGFCQRYLGFLAGLALLFWITSAFLLPKPGTPPSPIWLTVLELLGWVILIAAVVYSAKLTKRCTEVIAIVFLLTLGIDAYRLASAAAEKQGSDDMRATLSTMSLEQSKNPAFVQLTEFSSQRNILHILMDELQSTVLEKILEDDAVSRDKLQGFYFFPNTSADQSFTELSLPAVVSGEVFANTQDKTPYLVKSFRDNRLFDGLRSDGYRLGFHIHHLYCKPQYLDSCSATPQISSRPLALTLLDMAIRRIMPAFITEKLATKKAGPVLTWFGLGQLSSTTSGLAVKIFEEFNRKLSVRDIPPTYKFFHSLLTHSPLVLDADCSVRSEAKAKNHEAIVDQYKCGLKQLVNLLDALRRQGVYDNTLIVISSDHGGNFDDPAKHQALKNRSIPRGHFFRAQATLLIKPIESYGSLKVSEFPASLSDITSTVASLSKLKGHYPGVNVFNPKEDVSRIRKYHYSYWSIVRKNERMPQFFTYQIQGDVRDPESWSILHRTEVKKRPVQ